ncbi:DNA polymerase zeta [Salix suchowensis]|nr:DNA polymerase zeta [Salix suchowensis]
MPVEQKKDRVILKHPKGSSVEILYYGATVISWLSVIGQGSQPVECLFVSSKAALDGSKPVRGGIPVVFPCFGAPSHPEHAKLSQHGFARSSTWNFDYVVMDNDAGVSVRLSLYRLRRDPGEHQLSTDLHVTNKSDKPLEFQALLHNYLRAPANEVAVSNLQTLNYYDKTETTEGARTAAKVESRAVVDVRRFTDSVYENAPQHYYVAWPEGGVEIKTVNFKDVVVWNPKAEAGSKIGDMESQGTFEDSFLWNLDRLGSGSRPSHLPEANLTRFDPSPWSVPYVNLVTWHNVRQGRCAMRLALLMESNFHVRINQIDHCMVPPGPLDYSPFPKTPVPVLRVYGPTSSGQKACVYIHQVYPYFYVEYKGSMDTPYRMHTYCAHNPLLTDATLVLKYTRKLQRSLNHAIALSMKRDPHSPKSIFIRAVVVVKGVPFYGFHASYAPFLKIYMFDPTLLYRGVTILRSGTVMQTRLCATLASMGVVGLTWGKSGSEGRTRYVDPEKETTLRVSPYHKQAKMDLEVDVVAHQILNRNRLTTRDIHHQLQIPAAPTPTEPLILSVRELWEDERRRRLARGLSASPDMPVDLSENRRGTAAIGRLRRDGGAN